MNWTRGFNRPIGRHVLRLLSGVCALLFAASSALAASHAVQGKTGSADKTIADLVPDYVIEIRRERVVRFEKEKPGANVGVEGSLFVNGTRIGKTLENADSIVIPSGNFRANVITGVKERYADRLKNAQDKAAKAGKPIPTEVPRKNLIQGADGVMAEEGDFTVEVLGVEGHSGLYLHGGNKPRHSIGCVLLGPVGKNQFGQPTVTLDHPLYILRKLIYGTDKPNATPKKTIAIQVSEGRDMVWPPGTRPGERNVEAGRTASTSPPPPPPPASPTPPPPPRAPAFNDGGKDPRGAGGNAGRGGDPARGGAERGTTKDPNKDVIDVKSGRPI